MVQTAQIKNKVILSTGPSSVTGGALIHSSILEFFADMRAVEVWFVGFDLPFDYTGEKALKINYAFPGYQAENSAATQNTLAAYAVLEKLIDLAEEYTKRGFDIVFFASFLLPFADLVTQAAMILRARDINSTIVILPTGSDIWRLAERFPQICKAILDKADTIFTYSSRFAQQVESLTNYTRRVTVLPPIIDIYRFFPLASEKRQSIRNEMNIGHNDFLLLHVSNMRYVKGIKNMVQIAHAVADVIKEPTTLILVGPLTKHLEGILGSLTYVCSGTMHYHEYRYDRLAIRYYGPQKNVVCYNQIADFSINCSYHDSFNTSLAEGMACGIPIISSSVAGLLDFTDSDEIGVIYNYPFFQTDKLIHEEDIIIEQAVLKEIATYVRDIFYNKERWYTISKKVRMLIQKNFSRAVLSQQYQLLLSTRNE